MILYGILEGFEPSDRAAEMEDDYSGVWGCSGKGGKP